MTEIEKELVLKFIARVEKDFYVPSEVLRLCHNFKITIYEITDDSWDSANI